jgi:hypothetical protein
MIARKYQRDTGKSNPHFSPMAKKASCVSIARGEMKIERSSKSGKGSTNDAI